MVNVKPPRYLSHEQPVGPAMSGPLATPTGAETAIAELVEATRPLPAAVSGKAHFAHEAGLHIHPVGMGIRRMLRFRQGYEVFRVGTALVAAVLIDVEAFLDWAKGYLVGDPMHHLQPPVKLCL